MLTLVQTLQASGFQEGKRRHLFEPVTQLRKSDIGPIRPLARKADDRVTQPLMLGSAAVNCKKKRKEI